MAEKVEFEGKSLDLAIWNASQELKIPIEKMQYDIVSKGRRGRGSGDDGEPARIVVYPAGRPAGSPAPAPARPEGDRGRREPRRRGPEDRPASRHEARADDGDADEPEEDVDDEPADDEPLDDEPLDDEPLDDEPLDDEPADDEPLDDEPLDDEPADDEPLDDGSDDIDELPPAPGDGDEDDPIEEARRARRARPAASHREEDDDREPEEEVDTGVEEPERPRRRAGRGRPRGERSSARRAVSHGEDQDDRPGGVPDVEDLEAGMARAREVLPSVLGLLGFELTLDYEIREDHVYVPMEGDDGEFLLGERADGLNALQFLLNKMVYRGGPTRIVLDVNGYRRERQERLVAEALEAARRVKDSGESCTLDPMNPFERRLVHLALRDDPDVTTFSHGTAFMKQLEIAPKGAEPRAPRGRPRRPRRGRYRG